MRCTLSRASSRASGPARPAPGVSSSRLATIAEAASMILWHACARSSLLGFPLIRSMVTHSLPEGPCDPTVCWPLSTSNTSGGAGKGPRRPGRGGSQRSSGQRDDRATWSRRKAWAPSYALPGEYCSCAAVGSLVGEPLAHLVELDDPPARAGVAGVDCNVVARDLAADERHHRGMGPAEGEVTEELDDLSNGLCAFPTSWA